MNKPLIPVEEETYSTDLEPAALIGLGQRGCAVIRRLRPSLEFESCAFLFDDDPMGRFDNLGLGEGTDGNDFSDPIFDLSGCGLMGVVIVGADYHNPEIVQKLQRELIRNRPALLLGIVLPPRPGESVRLDPSLRAAWDCFIDWPNDPGVLVDNTRLAMAASDWLSPIFDPGMICLDISDMIILFGCGEPLALRVGSATLPFDQPQAAAQMALADLYRQGLVLAECTGVLVVMRVGLNFEMGHFEAVHAVFEALPLPESFTAAFFSAPTDQNCVEHDLIRVTVFAVCPPLTAYSDLSDKTEERFL